MTVVDVFSPQAGLRVSLDGWDESGIRMQNGHDRIHHKPAQASRTSGVKVLIGMGMQNAGHWNRAVHHWGETIPSHLRALAATD
ncbi:MAG: hypothetical protein JO033_21015 [Acidobacteriaceae bacterium]|nr:hypothetical protein [Acidobacteriaceae bacterium]